MNRAAREKLAAHARSMATEVVERGIVLAGDDGGLAPVSDERAKRTLARHFERCLKSGGYPLVVRLCEADAARFTHVRGAAPCPAWLALALGKDGRVSVIVRRLGCPFGAAVDPVLERAIVQAHLLDELGRLTASSDVPGLVDVAGSA